MKQKQIKEDSKALTKIFIGIALMMLILNLWWLFSDNYSNYYCSKNPDKCVCEEQFYLDDSSKEELRCEIPQWKGICDIPEKVCRLKTQTELDIDDYNNNPRGDEKCKCEETKDNLYDISQDTYENLLHTKSSLEFFSNVKCNFNAIPSAPDWETGKKEQLELTCYLQSTCLKSRPKFDYEKHPEDYVAEAKIIWEFAECQKQCFNLTLEECSLQKNCLTKQTTYRLKNECEKGNPDWVEENKTIYGAMNEVNCSFYLNFTPSENELWGCYTGNLSYQTICREKTK